MIHVLIYFGVEKGKQTTRLFPAVYLENLGALGDKVEAYPLRATLFGLPLIRTRLQSFERFI